VRYGFMENNICGVHFLSVPSFDETGICRTCFSTRLGGVSKPPLDSMNLGFGRGDIRENVIQNYLSLGNAAGFDAKSLVAFTQVHKNDVCVATAADAGEAFLPAKREFDAVITNTPSLPIGTYHADCVPVFLLDPVNRAVGIAHAGWRGTAMRTPAYAVAAMAENFGSNPRDILAAIGPAIGKCCFETDGEVPAAMTETFGSAARNHITDDANGKFHVDLPMLNVLSLLDSGIKDENITLSNECTRCKNDLYWSHRATGGVRGAMAAIITLREETKR